MQKRSHIFFTALISDEGVKAVNELYKATLDNQGEMLLGQAAASAAEDAHFQEASDLLMAYHLLQSRSAIAQHIDPILRSARKHSIYRSFKAAKLEDSCRFPSWLVHQHT